ncbi:MAG: Gfo/Idh/MocA family oxidoreductase [Bacilli bacterium]|nr:Gfo/Idh/MocA family oxidoreductase [Bacilli bacterium]MBN2696399.1 Gfo/Idh/MocA family oxidoreductase [Bacilli bacterium]
MLKVAIIGAGNIARTIHLPAYISDPDVTVVGIADVNEQTLKATADQFNVANRYTNYRDMITELSPDLVSVCSPNKYHFEQVMFALEKKAHVFCEKPPAINYREAKTMHELSRQNGLLLGFNFHHRYREETKIIKDWIDSRGTDKIYFCELEALRRRGIPGWGQFTNKEVQGGGPLIDFGIHLLDLALFLLDFPEPAYCLAMDYDLIGKIGGEGDFGKWDGGSKFQVEDSLFGQVTFKSGFSIQIKTAFAINMAEKSRMDLRFHAGDESISLSPLSVFNQDGLIRQSLIEPNRNLSALPSFLDYIKGNSDVKPVLSDSVLLTQKVIDCLYLSASTKKPVKVELD